MCTQWRVSFSLIISIYCLFLPIFFLSLSPHSFPLSSHSFGSPNSSFSLFLSLCLSPRSNTPDHRMLCLATVVSHNVSLPTEGLGESSVPCFNSLDLTALMALSFSNLFFHLALAFIYPISLSFFFLTVHTVSADKEYRQGHVSWCRREQRRRKGTYHVPMPWPGRQSGTTI